MEKSFDARALLAGTFDFVTCQRTDGTFYGTAGQCRKGVQVDAADYAKIKQAQLAEGAVYKSIGGGSANALSTQERLDAAASVGDYKGSKDNIDRLSKEYDKKYEENLKAVEEGRVKPDTMDDFISNYSFNGDASTASIMTIGIEETPPSGWEKNPAGSMNREIAERLTRHQMKQTEDSNDVDFVLNSKSVAGAVLYNKKTAEIMTVVSGQAISAEESISGFGRVAPRELRVLPSPQERVWPMGEMALAQAPGMQERFGTREAYQARYGQAMKQNLQRDVMKAVNGNAETIILTTSKTDPAAGQLRSSIDQLVGEKGGTSSSFTFNSGSRKATGVKSEADLKAYKGGRGTEVGTIYTIPKPNGRTAYIYDFGIGVSSKQVNDLPPGKMGKIMVRERQRMESKNFVPRTKTQAEALATNKQFALKTRAGQRPPVNSSNVGHLTPVNLRKAEEMGIAKRAVQAEMIQRGMKSAPTKAAPKPKVVKPKVQAAPKPAAKPARPQRSASEKLAAVKQIKDLLAKAKASRDSGQVRIYEDMLRNL